MTSDLAPAPMAGKIHLPPMFQLRRTTARDVVAEAARLAPSEGAGTLVVHQSPGLLAVAVVLEPEQKLSEARLAFILGMTALADALAAHCPPERPLQIIWPDQILYDAARLGGGRFAVAPGCGEDDVPAWMVFGAELIADRDHIDETGLYPGTTSLKEEAFDPAELIVSTFASYVALYFDRWAHEGFKSVGRRYVDRIAPALERGMRRIEGDRLVEVVPLSEPTLFEPLSIALLHSVWRDAKGPLL